MAKFNLDESGDLKKLAAEFEQMANAENLREANDAAEVQVKEQRERAAGALPRHTATAIIVGVAILLVVAVSLLITLSKKEKHGFKSVPNVVGQDVATARDLLRSEGFKVREEYDATSRATPGKIIAQDTPAGAKIEEGGSIFITIAGKAPGGGQSTAPPWKKGRRPGETNVNPCPGTTQPPVTENTANRVTVPKLEGMDLAKARGMLEAMGLQVEAKTVIDTTRQSGVVLSSDPRPETVVARGTRVRVVVNVTTDQPGAHGGNTSAAADTQVEIPVYFGKASQLVMDDLRAKGLSPSWRMEASQQLKPGYVIRTEPPAQSKVAKGAKVTVVIAK